MKILRKTTAQGVYQLRKLERDVRELDRFAALTPGEMRTEMNQRLWDQMQYFGNRADALPEWKEAARIQNPQELREVWSQLPILTKQDLQSQFDPKEMQQQFGLKGISASTGGSTGEPVHFFHDEAMMRHKAAARIFCRKQFGWRPGMPIVCIWGSERDVGHSQTMKGRFTSFVQNVHIVDGYHLDEKTVQRVREQIRRHAPVALYGFTTMLEYIAREMLAAGENYIGQVATAWNGGEMLYPEQSRLFQRVFGVPILNFYGGRELSSMAYQTGHGEPMKLIRPNLFLEIVDEAGQPVAPGTPGRLICTNTINRGTPFLRFDIGDLGMSSAEGQDESGIHSLSSLHGRSAGIIHLSNGKTINNLYWNHLFKDYDNVRQFQVAIIDGQELEIRLSGTPLSADKEEKLKQVIRKFVDPLPFNIRWVESIKRTKQGKLVQVVRESRDAEVMHAA
ncbi:AMP-binding enzyme [Polystyrenella longa]|uniref:AMP-binding enzyme n=1 Tax=Polystyrenella longa TaxID=2528007 RepID=A0A518CUD3_9PLAN|nr:AMP-binding protein [Polystyrenella longa]QDU82818.1 AMP-binding enzyme [Polystyrenella longa]